MVLELVRLGSLDKLLLSYGNAVRTRSKLVMCEQICAAMCELVDENVLHRDLAARNILVQSMEPVHIKVGGCRGEGQGRTESEEGKVLCSADGLHARCQAPDVATCVVHGIFQACVNLHTMQVTDFGLATRGAIQVRRPEHVLSCG